MSVTYNLGTGWNGFSLPRMLLPRMNSLQETGVSTYEPPDGGASPAEDTDWNANPIAKAHGTASVGVTTGIINGYGITGIAPSTEAYTYSEWTDQGGRRERAIAQAVA